MERLPNFLPKTYRDVFVADISIISASVAMAFLAISSVAKKLLAVDSHHAEPKHVAPSIPYIGHAIGMFRLKWVYLMKMARAANARILTLPLPASKVYVVADAHLTQSISKSPNTFQFGPIVAVATGRIGNLSPRLSSMLIEGCHERESLFAEITKYTEVNARPGPVFNGIVKVAGNVFVQDTDQVFQSTSSTRIDMFAWIRHHVIFSMSEGIYGKMNPFRDPSVETAFWDFAENFGQVILYPRFMLRFFKGYQGFQHVFRAFEAYFACDGHEHASTMVKDRIELLRAHNISLSDQARYETIHTFAMFGGTTVAAFWTIFNVFSHPAALDAVRTAAESLIGAETATDEGVALPINLTAMRKQALLASAVQETLRLGSTSVESRLVGEDTYLDGQYFLRKGNVVLLPMQGSHFDATCWGNDHQQFHVERFTRPKPDVQTGYFRGFGGGRWQCPGRHLATTQVLMILCALALRCDVEPVKGVWSRPALRKQTLPNILSAPKQDIRISITPRKSWQNKKLVYVVE